MWGRLDGADNIGEPCVAGDFPASADALGAAEDVIPAPVTVDDLWDVDFWIDGWIFQIDMRLADEAIGLDDNFSIGFDYFIKNMDWVVPVGMDFRYGRFGFMPDFLGFKMSGSGAASGGRMDYETASLDMTVTVLRF